MRPPPPTATVRWLTSSARGESAVDVDDLSGAKVRGWREQVERNADEILRLAEPAERNARQGALARRLADRVVLPHPGRELGAEGRRWDRVDPDPVLGPLGGQHPRQRIGGALGSAVGAVAREIAMSAARG